MLQVFLDVVLPVFIIAALGGLVGRWRGIMIAPISALMFYLLSPALIFHSMATSNLSASTSLQVVVVLVAGFVAIYICSTIWSVAVRHDPPMRAGFALAATTPNLGNMGLPISQLAFGDAGFTLAVVNLVAGTVLANSAGIGIASMAGGSRRAALVAPFRYPLLYAAAVGLAVNVSGIDLPVFIEAPAASLAGAAVPVMLVVLGLQLQHAVGGGDFRDLIALNVARAVVGPAVAWFAATALGMEGVERGTLVVLAAMPTAVVATIIATEFAARPAFVTRAVVSSTLASMLTLTVLIALLK